ncbi:hypothetical protein M1384_01265 [Candidatus Parvarchaeota archaeon]|jgi:hypothetical protein|nr:hypothetical protein [Candidatus Parvarchaeota archaeon]
MEGENSLDNIISDDEAKRDEITASIFRFSANMKKDLKLVKDPNGLELYYLSISPNNKKYLEKIGRMNLDEISVLYAALKHPVMFADVAKKELEYLNQNFEGLDVKYDIITTKINEKEMERLSDLYLKAKEVETKDDLKYAEMYDVSSRIKDKGVKVVLTSDENTLEFYLTELSELGRDGKKIIDYLSGLKNEDTSYFMSISSLFSIIDTNNKVLYAMESFKDKEGNEIVKMSVHDKKETDFKLMYSIAKRAKENPTQKVLFIDEDEETYKPSTNPPSDMYS